MILLLLLLTFLQVGWLQNSVPKDYPNICVSKAREKFLIEEYGLKDTPEKKKKEAEIITACRNGSNTRVMPTEGLTYDPLD